MYYKKIAEENVCIVFELYLSLMMEYQESKNLSYKTIADALEVGIDELYETCINKVKYLSSDDCSEENARKISKKIVVYISFIEHEISKNKIIDALNLLSQLRIGLRNF